MDYLVYDYNTAAFLISLLNGEMDLYEKSTSVAPNT